jgi:membrane protein DedA with SNARE-associated domain
MTTTARRRLVVGLVLLVLAASVASLTVGRDLFAGRTPDLGSFALVNFAGYLFFIVLPVEILVPWYLAAGHAGHWVALLAVGTAVAAQLADYGIGRLVSGGVIEHLISRERIERARAKIDRYGGWTIFLFNLLPLSSPTMAAAAGVVRFGPLRALAWSTSGLVIKYATMVWLFGSGSPAPA